MSAKELVDKINTLNFKSEPLKAILSTLYADAYDRVVINNEVLLFNQAIRTLADMYPQDKPLIASLFDMAAVGRAVNPVRRPMVQRHDVYSEIKTDAIERMFGKRCEDCPDNLQEEMFKEMRKARRDLVESAKQDKEDAGAEDDADTGSTQSAEDENDFQLPDDLFDDGEQVRKIEKLTDITNEDDARVFFGVGQFDDDAVVDNIKGVLDGSNIEYNNRLRSVNSMITEFVKVFVNRG